MNITLHTHKSSIECCVTGYYIYTESSAPRKQGDNAKLVSPMFGNDRTGKSCFTFWYHMHGANVGRLNVYLRQQGNADILVWSMIGNQPNLWYYNSVNLNTQQQFQVKI